MSRRGRARSRPRSPASRTHPRSSAGRSAHSSADAAKGSPNPTQIARTDPIDLRSRGEEPAGVTPQEAERPSRIHMSIKVFPGAAQAPRGGQNSMKVMRGYDGRQAPHSGEFETTSECVTHLFGRVRSCTNRELIDREIDYANQSTEPSTRHEKRSARQYLPEAYAIEDRTAAWIARPPRKRHTFRDSP